MNFIEKIFKKECDDSVHLQLIRYGKGDYKGRAPISIAKTSKVKLKSGFEFANDFVSFAAGLDDLKFDGFIWSKNPLEGVDLQGQKKTGKWVYEVADLSSEEVKKIGDQAYYLLLNCDEKGVKLKIKKKLPKPGKDEEKIDDKFCQMEIDADKFEKARSDFFWDIGECKKASAVHEFIIRGIEIPAELRDSKDFALVREKSKRVGKLIRHIKIDNSEKEESVDFEA